MLLSSDLVHVAHLPPTPVATATLWHVGMPDVVIGKRSGGSTVVSRVTSTQSGSGKPAAPGAIAKSGTGSGSGSIANPAQWGGVPFVFAVRPVQ